jgi:hypothetical protein
MKNLGQVRPSLSRYVRWQLLEHGEHECPPALRFRVGRHFRRIRGEVAAVVLERTEQQLAAFED